MRSAPMLVRGLALVLLLSVLSGCGLFGEDKKVIKVELATSSGLFLGNDVGVLGVKIGEVTDIESKGDHVVVTLEVDPDVKIPEKAGAVVVSRSMATDRYVELTPAYTTGRTMESGALIKQEKTRTPVEWDSLLKSVDVLAEGLNGKGSEPLRQLLDSAATNLDGNGKQIRATLRNLVEGTGVFAENGDAFADAMTNLDTLTAVLAKNDQLTRTFIKNLSASTEMVRDERLNIEAAVNSVSDTLSLLAIFVRHHKGDMSTTRANVEDLVKRILKHRNSLAEALEVMPVAMENLGRAVNNQGRLDVKLPASMLLPGGLVLDTICGATSQALCDALDVIGLPEIIGGVIGGGLGGLGGGL